MNTIEEKLQKANPGVFQEIVIGNGYSLSKGCFKDRLVVDVGAHIGTFTYMAHEVGEAKHVVSVEPNRKNFSVLHDAFGVVENVTLFNRAISYNDKPVMVSDSDNVSTTGHGDLIDAITLKEICDAHPESKGQAILKMDIEGYEYDVLWSASRETLQFFQTLFLETHLDSAHAEAMNLYLQKLGFKIASQYRMFSWNVLPDGTRTNWQPLNAWVSKFDQ